MKRISLLLLFVCSAFTLMSQSEVQLNIQVLNPPDEPVVLYVTVYGPESTSFEGITDEEGWYHTQFETEEWNYVYVSLETCNGYDDSLLFANSGSNPAVLNGVLNYCYNQPIFGCTDPEAINYNPAATVDDGSCEYESDCDANEATLVIHTNDWASEMSWNIVLGNTEVYGGGNYEDGEDYEIPLCLHDTCYTFEMFDSYGDGWNGGEFEIFLEGVVIASGALTSGSYGEVTFGVNTEDCESPVYGCTDPEAVNYNPEATVDDGSCTYITAENDLCENASVLEPGTHLINNTSASQNEGIWGECWGFGAGEGEQTSLWYQFTTPDEPATIHIEASGDGTGTLTDTQFGLFNTCGGEMIYCDGNSGDGLFSGLNFSCGELEQGETYRLIVDGWSGDAGTCFLTYSVSTNCDSLIYGCTDPEAINYNPAATLDDGSCEYESDCDANEATLVIHTNDWASEMSWNIVLGNTEVYGGGNYEDGEDYEIPLCLQDSCYTFEMFDSYGDGWNGGEFVIFLDGVVIASGTLSSGSYGEVTFGVNTDCEPPVYGCTDPEAINYNPEATVDDGSCEYISECTEVTLVLDGNSLLAGIWTLEENGMLIDSNYYGGSAMEYPLCLEDGCYDLTVHLFETDTISSGVVSMWSDGTLLFVQNLNGPFTHIQFGIGGGCDSTTVIYGCTDPEATNYNPEATVDDGSCEYEFGCSINFTVVPDSSGENTIWIIPSDNIINATEVLWDFGDGTTSTDFYPEHQYDGDGPYTLCLSATFESPDGGFCDIEYCVEISGNMLGSGLMSSGFMINVLDPAILSTSLTEENINLTLYPNPTSGKATLNFSLTSAEMVEIRLFDISGKMMHSEKMKFGAGENSLELDVDRQESGMYLLELITSSGAYHTKMIKR